jgi:hypothetical protein
VLTPAINLSLHGVNDTGVHFAAGVVDTSGVPIVAKILAHFFTKFKMTLRELSRIWEEEES